VPLEVQRRAHLLPVHPWSQLRPLPSRLNNERVAYFGTAPRAASAVAGAWANDSAMARQCRPHPTARPGSGSGHDAPWSWLLLCGGQLI